MKKKVEITGDLSVPVLEKSYVKPEENDKYKIAPQLPPVVLQLSEQQEKLPRVREPLVQSKKVATTKVLSSSAVFFNEKKGPSKADQRKNMLSQTNAYGPGHFVPKHQRNTNVSSNIDIKKVAPSPKIG